MKRFTLAEAPAEFEELVEKPGGAWLGQNPTGRPPPYWAKVYGDVSDAFDGLCAYSVVFLSGAGTVDHWISIDEDRSQAYAWSNYRHCAGWLNSSKQALRADQLLDPFEVQDEWFELTLPSLQLTVTDKCPDDVRGRAEFTIKRLKLRDGERAIRGRQTYMELYRNGKMSLDAMDHFCPLLARALRRTLQEDEQKKG